MAKKNPSTRWFFKDWHEDEGLQLCSLAARGLWIELLVICAANGGYLLVGDKIPPSVAALARFVRATPAQVGRLLAELDQHQVFSRDERGVIFCRRMVRQNGDRDRQTANRAKREHDPNQADLFEIDPPRVRADPHDKAFKLSEQEPESLPDSESPAAREDEKINMGESSERPAGAFREVGEVVKTETPVGMVPAGAPTGDADACTSSSSATDYRGLDRQDQDQGSLADGAASNGAALPGADRQHSDDGPGKHSGQFAPLRQIANCRPAPRADRPRPRTKTPALKARIKHQLVHKLGRYVVHRCSFDEQMAWWEATATGDDMQPVDPVAHQRAIDMFARRMRNEHWDDKREVAQ